MPTPPPAHALGRRTLLLLSSTILVAVLAHYAIASPYIASLALLVWCLKTGLIITNKKNPPIIVIMLFTVLSILMILWFYGGWNGQKAGISFLVLLVTLKFLESATLRDYFVICLLLLFVASASFLFHNTLTTILIVSAFVVVVLALLFIISSPTKLPFSASIKQSFNLIARALPLAVLLFFLFPRIQGNFGFIPSQDRLDSDRELSNSLVAGEFANQAFNDRLAFRAEFDGSPPVKSRLYWRSKVMTEESFFSWKVQAPSATELRLAKLRKRSPNELRNNQQEPIRYSIVHENSADQYLPYLDYAYAPEVGIQLDDHSVFKDQTTNGIFAYRGASYDSPTVVEGLPINRAKLLTTRSTPKARTSALLGKWRRETRDPRQLVQLAFDYFKNNDFEYTLDPAELIENPLDEFLFDTREGYCEHYASAFTTLMRWQGVPARIVVGYLGGETNSVGNFVEVKYLDAHAWSEVWIDGAWHRVDPTAAANQTRIEHGMEAFLNIWEQGELANGRDGTALADFLDPSGLRRALNTIKQSWGNLGYQWNKWVVNYDFNAQKELLAQLGFESRNTVYTLVILMSVGLLSMMLFYFWQLIPKAARLGESQQAFLRFLQKFKRHDLFKSLSESPNEFGVRAAIAFPEQALEIRDITDRYSQIRYGKENSNIDSFKSAVKQFKLKPTKYKDQSIEPDAENKKMKNITDDFYVAGQLTENDFPELAKSGIKTIINNRPDGEEAGQLESSEARQLAEKHGMDYHYLPMVGGQPLPPMLVDDFKSTLDESQRPVLAHCRSGWRSSFLWSMGQIAAGNISADDAIKAAGNAGIPLEQARATLEAQQS
jgi:uncharacterized protein (TIGR01244 family)